MKQSITVNPHFPVAARSCPPVTVQRKLAPGWLLRQLTDRLHRWREISRERYLLLTLSDEMLKDIGISRRDAEREARRPFWDDQGVRR